MRSLRFLLAVFAVLAFGSLGAASNLHAQNSPRLTLHKDCIDTLKDHDYRLRAAGATKRLLAWTPLLVITGEDNFIHLSWTVATMPWVELANSFSTVNQLVFSTLATDALNHSRRHEDEPELQAFWRALSRTYASRL
jgi:hypothetical protein